MRSASLMLIRRFWLGCVGSLVRIQLLSGCCVRFGGGGVGLVVAGGIGVWVLCEVEVWVRECVLVVELV